MNNVQWLLGTVLGMIVGILLYRLPFRLYYRHATWVTEDEFLTALPDKRWVTRALYGLVPLWFFLFVVLMMSTDRMKGPLKDGARNSVQRKLHRFRLTLRDVGIGEFRIAGVRPLARRHQTPIPATASGWTEARGTPAAC